MQMDFHYYATCCAALLAGYSHEEALTVAYSAQFVDCCTRTLLSSVKGPRSAATTQLQMELMNARTDPVGLQDITRIWASFHFLPGDLCAPLEKASRIYRDKYRLICNPNGSLLAETVKLAAGSSLQAVGVAMHVLADTWAHRYFAGTPSLVINNTDFLFTELLPDGTERPVAFRHSPGAPDDIESGVYNASIYQFDESSIMNLGHGRAGHLPDYSFMRYRYAPAWGRYETVVKDNPAEYECAFRQMVYAMKFLRGIYTDFETGRYDEESVDPWIGEIRAILTRRQADACADWKALGERLSGHDIPDFDQNRYLEEYRSASKEEREKSFLGLFFLAALAQKSMVTNRIFRSGSLLAGFSVEYAEKGFRGIRDFIRLVEEQREEERHDRRTAR